MAIDDWSSDVTIMGDHWQLHVLTGAHEPTFLGRKGMRLNVNDQATLRMTHEDAVRLRDGLNIALAKTPKGRT